MPMLYLLGIMSFWASYAFRGNCTPKAPAIKDYEKFNRETIGMDAKQIRYGLRSGRW